MGHSLLGRQKRTRQYRQVIALMACGADPAQIAQIVLQSAEKHLNLAADDPLVIETMYLLMQLPLAARQGNFAKALREAGLDVAGPPDPDTLVSALVQELDRRFGDNTHRTDLGELAVRAAVESLHSHLRQQLGLLYDAARPEDVQGELKRMRSANQFGLFGRRFIGAMTGKLLDYLLGPALAENTGEGSRFPTLAAARLYREALQTHCHEAAAIVEGFTGDWYSKTVMPGKTLTRDEVRKYVFGASQKLLNELKYGL